MANQLAPGAQQLPGAAPPRVAPTQAQLDELHRFVGFLTHADSSMRENALLELSKKREDFPDLAPLFPATLTAVQSNRVCNALALLQCVASHADTRTLFLGSYIPLYLYPFLNTASKAKPFEYLRLTSLGVIGALVKMDDTEVVNFLLTTDIIPLCLRIMETGTELSKTVATFIVQKIMLDEAGLTYICATAERFFTVAAVLGNMVTAISDPNSHRLLKHIIRCYLRLVDNTRARDALRTQLPAQLKDNTFVPLLRNDRAALQWLQQLMRAVYPDAPALPAI